MDISKEEQIQTSYLHIMVEYIEQYGVYIMVEYIEQYGVYIMVEYIEQYGVYISQLIRYARASSNYSDFLKRHLHLRNRLLDQGY